MINYKIKKITEQHNYIDDVRVETYYILYVMRDCAKWKKKLFRLSNYLPYKFAYVNTNHTNLGYPGWGGDQLYWNVPKFKTPDSIYRCIRGINKGSVNYRGYKLYPVWSTELDTIVYICKEFMVYNLDDYKVYLTGSIKQWKPFLDLMLDKGTYKVEEKFIR